jgi:hypothetical protein
MILFRLFLVAAIAVLLIALSFFFIGIGDGSVSSFNMTMWLALLGALIASVGGGVALNGRGQRRAATAVLGLVAAPGILAGLFFLILLIAQPRWN